jgi:hypothetical protein
MGMLQDKTLVESGLYSTVKCKHAANSDKRNVNVFSL